MVWYCLFGVPECPICKRNSGKTDARIEARAKARAAFALAALDEAIASGRVKARRTSRGRIEFIGLSDEERGGGSDECLFSALSLSGSGRTKATLSRLTAGNGALTIRAGAG